MDGTTLAYTGAGLAAIFGALASSIGMYFAGAKAAGVLGEKPELFGKLLVIAALPGSQGIYGLLIALMTFKSIGDLGAEITTTSGAILLLAGCVMAFSALASAFFQGKVCAGCIGAIARDGSVSGKSIILSALIETYAVFGLIVSILMITNA